jgi:hypothetical protein
VSVFSHLDHLVIAADSLAQGVTWCEGTLGVTPSPGGEHPLMGTHNRLLRIASADFPTAYLEIIAVNPDAPEPGRKRWFDLDDPELREAVRHQPRLVHYVANCEPVLGGLRGLDVLGIDRGALLSIQRETPHGVLQWKISVRPDGQRLFYGTLPTLIEWGQSHPTDSLPDRGLSLLSLTAMHPRPDDLAAAYNALGLEQVEVDAGPPNLVARLMTPLGEVTLESKGI